MLSRTRARAAALLAVLALVLVGLPSQAVAADAPCLKVSESTGQCVLRASDPGTPPGQDPGPGRPGGTSTGPRVCEYNHEPIECETDAGSWNNDRGCYMELADPQPPVGGYEWDGHTDGVVYRCLIPIPYSTGASWTTYVWLPTAEPGPEPRELAEEALAQMELRAGQIATNPPSPNGLSVVGLQTWLWIADPDEHTVGPITRSATAGAVTVTATARLDKVVWDMGDGRSTTCTGGGTPWSATTGTGDSPTCGHTYRRSSARQPDQRYTITATSYWTIEWAGGGETGTIEMDFSNTAQLRVAEVQALVTTGD